MLLLKLRLWLAKRIAILLVKLNLFERWRIRLIHKVYDLHSEIEGRQK